MSKKRQAVLEDEGIVMRTFAVNRTGGVIPWHAHDWRQLVYASRGVLYVQTERGSWVVPSERAVWVEAGVRHQIEMTGRVWVRTVYLPADGPSPSPFECGVVHVTPLLRELILHAVEIGVLKSALPAHVRLAGVIRDQLSALPVVPLQIPMPIDVRAKQVAERLQANPRDCGSLNDLGNELGAGKRTLERLFLNETGLTFGKWRQRLRLLHALRLLAAGESVQRVADLVGYESPSAFIAMFRAAFGTTPHRYFVNPGV
jgi:AraC-like DNA-binding protein